MKKTRVTNQKYLDNPVWSRIKFFFILLVAIPYMIGIVVVEAWPDIRKEFREVFGFVFLPWDTKDD